MKKCLLVDDDSANRKVARKYIERIGFEVLEANNTLEAVEMCRDNVPDVIILDVMMEGINGIDCIQLLREVPGVENTCIIMCSADSSPQTIGRTAMLGVGGYIVKPFYYEIFHEKFLENGLITNED